jgi:hypothetical protein
MGNHSSKRFGAAYLFTFTVLLGLAAYFLWLARTDPLSHPAAASVSSAIAAPTLAAKADPATPAPEPNPEKALNDFREWTTQYRIAPTAAARSGLEAQGETLAKQRAEAMSHLIETDPQRALQEAVPFWMRRDLPASITQHLEQPVSGRGTFGVLGVYPDPSGEPPVTGISRTVHLGDAEYEAERQDGRA